MPRTNGTYSKPPDTTAQPNTTIESAMFNEVVDDIVNEQNEVRPVSAGGTGAANAADARANLQLDTAAHKDEDNTFTENQKVEGNLEVTGTLTNNGLTARLTDFVRKTGEVMTGLLNIARNSDEQLRLGQNVNRNPYISFYNGVVRRAFLQALGDRFRIRNDVNNYDLDIMNTGGDNAMKFRGQTVLNARNYSVRLGARVSRTWADNGAHTWYDVPGGHMMVGLYMRFANSDDYCGGFRSRPIQRLVNGSYITIGQV